MKIGSLFSGYGGLDMAVQSHFGGELAWYSEIEPAACKVLATLHPDVPNIGDITKVDWSQVEPVDIITGGYPCQPFSNAGLRKGKNDERHLWPYVRDALSAIRPRLAVLENVRGHITLGFGDVLADLAHMGWDAQWGIVRAAEAGAPHNRARLFILAYPNSEGLQGTNLGLDLAARWSYTRGHTPQSIDSNSANSDSTGSEASDNGRPRDGFQGRSQPMERGWSIATDSSGERHKSGERPTGVGRVGSTTESSGRQTSTTWQEPGTGSTQDVAHAHCDGAQLRGQSATQENWSPSRTNRCDRVFVGVDWGHYAPAIERWQHVIGRAAPAPTIQRAGRDRLNPVFVEWMMGLPAGHVTGHGLSAAQELKMLGNGVVPQQAALALQLLAVST